MVVLGFALGIIINVGIYAPFAHLAIIIYISKKSVGVFAVDIANGGEMVFCFFVSQYIFIHGYAELVLEPYTAFDLETGRTIVAYLPVEAGIEV